jgi:ubiquitin-protein ligase
MAQPYVKRISREMADIQKNTAAHPDIYYSFDDANMLKARAMIIGPAETPYAYCPLVYDIQFPTDYPHTPPKVLIRTSDGVTRFHPNMYVDGKVCLSILGTWTGPAWSPALTANSVMLTIQSLLEANPLRNEPGGRENLTLENTRAKVYADVVNSRLTSFTFRRLCRWKRDRILPDEWVGFEDVLEERGEELFAKLYEHCVARAQEGDKYLDCNEYQSLRGKTDWESLTILGKNVLEK